MTHPRSISPARMKSCQIVAPSLITHTNTAQDSASPAPPGIFLPGPSIHIHPLSPSQKVEAGHARHLPLSVINSTCRTSRPERTTRNPLQLKTAPFLPLCNALPPVLYSHIRHPAYSSPLLFGSPPAHPPTTFAHIHSSQSIEL